MRNIGKLQVSYLLARYSVYLTATVLTKQLHSFLSVLEPHLHAQKLQHIQEEGRTWFSGGWQGCSEGFPRAKPEKNPEEQPCQPKEYPILPDSFTQIGILFPIGFRIGPPKMHRPFRIGLQKILRRFRTGPPNIHRRFRIVPPQVTLNLLPPEFHSR